MWLCLRGTFSQQIMMGKDAVISLTRTRRKTAIAPQRSDVKMGSKDLKWS